MTDPVLVLDTREGASVDLILSDTYPGLVDAASIALDPGTPLVGIAGCVELVDARSVALPGPTRTPEPTETPAPSEPAADPDEPAVQG